uniref:Sex peptide receptor-like n=1 Tax=Crassostrea virginica TaxID=6565 RepID=A0A8B8BXZ7_CRAVI|nr:sex peptide receptor-like [Crassostrea virginica]
MKNVTWTGSEDDALKNGVVYGSVSAVICTLGVLLNILNFLIWNRKATGVSESLLAALGVTDGLVLFSYLIFSVYFFIVSAPYADAPHSEEGMYLVIISFHAFLAFHMMSNLLTVALAVVRYCLVCHGYTKSVIDAHGCKIKVENLIILLGFLVTVLATLPFHFYYKIHEHTGNSTNHTGFWIQKTDFAENHVYEYQVPVLWLYGVVFKIIPCAVIVVLSGFMVKSVRKAKKRKHRISTVDRFAVKRISSEYNRITLMLVVIVMIYVLSEVPVAISAFISGLHRAESHFFYFLLFSTAGAIMDIITVLNATANFFIYISMCKKYRQNLRELFKL